LGRVGVISYSGFDAERKILGLDAIVDDYAYIRVEDVVAIDVFIRFLLFLAHRLASVLLGVIHDEYFDLGAILNGRGRK
jgi:hypothetical protein